MAENEPEYPIRVPLVDELTGTRKVIGEAEINADGSTSLKITDEDYARVLQPPPYSLSLPEKTLQDVINDGVTEAADAAHEAVMQEFEKNTAGGMDHFVGLAGISREVMEMDAEDHIIRGVD